MISVWRFAALEPVHQVKGRARFRYRLQKGAAIDGKAAARAVENLYAVQERLSSWPRPLIDVFRLDVP